MSLLGRILVLIASLTALAWMAGLVWFITIVPNSPATDERNTDAIVVLTGGGMRLEHGLALMAEARANRLFVSGVEEGVTLAILFSRKDFQPFEALVPPERIELGHKAHSTVGNARETAEWARQQHVKSIRLVTSNYHMPRSLYEFHAMLPDVAIYPEPVFRSTGMQLMLLVISEYHKLIASYVRHNLTDTHP
jgi:uncharacterized SAM-binding protein YcdF (DUF218 family)